MKLDINTLVRQVAVERDIEPEKLIDAVAEAISSAARKHYKERNVLHRDRRRSPARSGAGSCATWSRRSRTPRPR